MRRGLRLLHFFFLKKQIIKETRYSKRFVTSYYSSRRLQFVTALSRHLYTSSFQTSSRHSAQRLSSLTRMSLSNPVAIALCGKSQTMASSFSNAIEKEGYKVIHTCNDVSTAKSTLPSLLRSDAGPIAVIIGKGFSDAEMQDIIAHCKQEAGETKTAWLLPDDDKFTAAMKAKAVFSAGSALPGLIASRAAESLRDNGVVAGKSLNELKGGTYGF